MMIKNNESQLFRLFVETCITIVKHLFWKAKNSPSLREQIDEVDEILDRVDSNLHRKQESEDEYSPLTDKVDAVYLADALGEDTRSIPYVPLLSDWIVEGGNTIIFSSTDQGKTSLSMQIAIDMARGQGSDLFSNDQFSYSSVKVIYYNGELEEPDLKHRFPNPGLYRGIDFTLVNGNPFGSVEKFLEDVAERVAGLNKSCVVFIDNITKYFPTFQAESARKFYARMERIQYDVHKMNPNVSLTFLLVGHTTKTDGAIGINDLTGSSNLGNFAKTMIALCPTQDNMVKYLKLVKAKHHITGDPVVVVKKLSLPYWHFEYVAEMTEKEAMVLGPDDLEKLSPSGPKQRGRKQKVSDEQIVSVKRKVDDSGCTVVDAIKVLNLDITEKTYYERLKGIAPEA